MYHPTTMGALAEAHRQDLLRESAATWRTERGNGAAREAERRPTRLAAHPRLVTAAVTLLVAFGLSAAL